MTIVELYLLFASIAMVGTAFHGFFTNQKDEFNRTSFVFILFLGYWHFIVFGLHSSERPEMATAWAILGALRFCGAPLFLHFMLHATSSQKNERSLRLYLLLYTPALIVCAGELAGILTLYTPVRNTGVWVMESKNFLVEVFRVGWVSSFMIMALLVTVSASIAGEHGEKKTNRSILPALFVISLLLGISYVVDIRMRLLPGAFLLNGLSFYLFTTWIYRKRNLFTVSPLTAANDILKAIPDALFITTTDGIIIRSNPKARNVTGYDAVGLRYKHIDGLFSDGFAQALYNRVADSSAGIWRQEAILHEKKGAGIPVVVNTSLIFKGRKRMPVAMVISCRDSSFEKLALDEFRKTEQLEALGFLAGGIAHDFNNLLTSIVAYLSLARSTENLSGSLKDTLDKVDSAAHMVINLNRQLATLSKGAAPDKSVCSLPEILHDAIQLALSGSRIECHDAIPADLHAVAADVTQMNQVFLNLIVNARQSMEQGGIIGVICRNVTVDGVSWVEVVVTDQGCGISEDAICNVFKPFFTTKSQGTGLGLSVVKSVIEKHGGTITVSSRVGIGSSFVVRLPAYSYTAESRQIVKEYESDSSDDITGNILVMDDEEGVLNVMSLTLEKKGHKVTAVEHGADAIKEFLTHRSEGEPFDILILDVTIRNGYGAMEVIRRLKEIDPDVCAVVMSGYRENTLMKKYHEYGFAEMIPKPFDAQLVYQVVNKLLRERNASA